MFPQRFDESCNPFTTHGGNVRKRPADVSWNVPAAPGKSPSPRQVPGHRPDLPTPRLVDRIRHRRARPQPCSTDTSGVRLQQTRDARRTPWCPVAPSNNDGRLRTLRSQDEGITVTLYGPFVERR